MPGGVFERDLAGVGDLVIGALESRSPREIVLFYRILIVRPSCRASGHLEERRR